MCPAHIAFSTPKKLKFTWTDAFEDIEISELEDLIVECRSALHSLEAELAARQNPRVDTKLDDCYARLQEKARTINDLGALSNKDRASLEEAGTFLEALKSGHIDSSQTRESRKGGAIYAQLLWLISRTAGPAYALLLICGMARRTVERLNSFQSAILVKHVARYCDPRSSRVLEEKANELGLCNTNTSLSVPQRASGKRKRGQSNSTTPSIVWTDKGQVESAVNTEDNTSKAKRQCEKLSTSATVTHQEGASRRELRLTSVLAARMSHSPSSPPALLVPENLLHSIKVYFENGCRNMILDDHGTLLTPNGAKLHNGLCNDFDSYCFTATMLLEKGLHIEFRRALSRASALVEQILRAEHPRTLTCFLEVLIYFIQTGFPEVTSFLRGFIQRMAAKVIRKDHLWSQICRLLGELDSESLDQAMAQIWKCTTDTFDSELGTLSRLAVFVRLDYIKRVYGTTNYLEEERLLRDLLAQFGGIPTPPPPRVMLNLAHNFNRQGRHDEAEEMALEVLSLLQKYEIYAERVVERIESLKIVSRSQFNQGKTLAAEQTMRKAIRMIMDQWGRQHSWVPEFMYVLEGWLRGWGREEDANTLRREIEELMGKDEIDEQLNGV